MGVMAEHNLPPQANPLIGRKEELAYVAARLDDPACRLLTIVGPGGVGKTRLAIEAVSHTADAFADGVYFVDLQAVEAAGFLSDIADALPLSLSGREPPQNQLLNYLESKDILLLLDNFEHLLHEATFLSELLSRVPSVKLLVTSREALNLQDEWLYPLRGLPVPPAATADDVAGYAAVQLFLERARRVRPHFSLDEERQGVVRVCRLVEGVPLALELAASWTKTLSCVAIADEIECNIDFLSTDLRDVPQRHRSMQAVFEQSWQLLGEEERNVFGRLSLFRGGFRRDAAQAVAGASLFVLSTLLDKSLLRREASGRYAIHELLRQYAEEKLAHASSEDVASIRDRHCAYYMSFLAERKADISGGRQIETSAEIAAELENVRAAWQWAVAREKTAEIAEAAFALYYFCQFGNRYLEGAQMFEQAVQILDDDTLSAQPQATLVLTCLGWFHMRLGRFAKSRIVFSRSHTLHRRFDEPLDMPYAFDPALGLGLLASMHGDYGEAERLLEQALQRSEQQGHLVNQESAHCFLAGIRLAQGQHEAAQQHARAACTAAQALQERWFKAYCLNEMGNAAAALGDYDTARRHYEASYAIREQFDDAEGMAVALNHLGQVALQQQDVVKAQRLFRESLEVYRGIDDKGGLATALHGLGRTALACDDLKAARQTLQRALRIATDIEFVPLLLNIIVSAAELLLKNGASAVAIAWLVFVQQHPTADHGVRTRAKQMRAHVDGETTGRPESTSQEVQSWTLPEVVADVQTRLDLGAEVESEEPGKQTQATPLVEPLTEREEEVLQLLAQGLTNKDIAEELTVVVGTVKSHNHNIYTKLGVDNRTQAVARARELHLI